MDGLREKTKLYCKTNGVKYKYIAEEINVSPSMLSHYLKGRKRLGKQKLLKLKQIIN